MRLYTPSMLRLDCKKLEVHATLRTLYFAAAIISLLAPGVVPVRVHPVPAVTAAFDAIMPASTRLADFVTPVATVLAFVLPTVLPVVPGVPSMGDLWLRGPRPWLPNRLRRCTGWFSSPRRMW